MSIAPVLRLRSRSKCVNDLFIYPDVTLKYAAYFYHCGFDLVGEIGTLVAELTNAQGGASLAGGEEKHHIENSRSMSKQLNKQERRQRSERRKAHKVKMRVGKLLKAAREGLTAVRGRIADPVWNAQARRIASDPSSDPDLASVLATALEIHSIEQSARAKERNNRNEERRRQEDIRKAKIAKEIDANVQSLRALKESLDLDEWCLYLARNRELRILVGVRNRPFKITLGENAVLKAKVSELSARKYIYRTTLIKRGWSAELIDSVLGTPDKMVPNPHYRSGPPAMLYSIERVEAAARA